MMVALLIGSQTISAQNKDNKDQKQRPTPEQMMQRQANQMVKTLMLDDATASLNLLLFTRVTLKHCVSAG